MNQMKKLRVRTLFPLPIGYQKSARHVPLDEIYRRERIFKRGPFQLSHSTSSWFHRSNEREDPILATFVRKLGRIIRSI